MALGGSKFQSATLYSDLNNANGLFVIGINHLLVYDYWLVKKQVHKMCTALTMLR